MTFGRHVKPLRSITCQWRIGPRGPGRGWHSLLSPNWESHRVADLSAQTSGSDFPSVLGRVRVPSARTIALPLWLSVRTIFFQSHMSLHCFYVLNITRVISLYFRKSFYCKSVRTISRQYYIIFMSWISHERFRFSSAKNMYCEIKTNLSYFRQIDRSYTFCRKSDNGVTLI